MNTSPTTVTSVMADTNTTQISLDQYRDDLSDQMALTLLPAMLVLGVVLVAGTMGNTLVFFIYLKFQPSSARSTILAMAVLDFITCAVVIPGEILDLRYSYSFSSVVLCKSLRFVTTLTLMASGMTLLAVALDRYHRICHPLREQLTAKQAWKRVCYACILSTAFAALAAVIYGQAWVQGPTAELYGIECSISHEYANDALPIAYNALLTATFFFAFLAMIVIYVLIWRQALKQDKFRSSVRRRVSLVGPHLYRSSSVGEPGCDEVRSFGEEHKETTFVMSRGDKRDRNHSHSDNPRENKRDKEHSPSDINKDSPSSLREKGEHVEWEASDPPSGRSQSSRDMPSSPTQQVPNEPKLSRKSSILRRIRKRTQSGEMRTRKTTLMLFLITIAFVVSFVPHLLLKTLQSVNKEFMTDPSTVRLVLYNVFVRSYFFNTAVNSFIYGFCSHKFRHECRRVLLSLTFWVKQTSAPVQRDDLM